MYSHPMSSGSVGVSSEHANQVLVSSISKLRWEMKQMLRTIYDGPRGGQDVVLSPPSHPAPATSQPLTAVAAQANSSFISKMKKHVESVTECVNKSEDAIAALPTPTSPPHLGNIGAMCQDHASDKAAIFAQLQTHTYPWSRQVEEYTSLLNAILQQNQLKRSQLTRSQVTRGQRRLQNTGYIVPPQDVEFVIADLSRRYPDLTLRKYWASSCTLIEVSLGHVLRALLVLRGIVIEQVIVKGFDESFFLKSGDLDMWSPSKSKTFQKITENATTAMLHFCSPLIPNPESGIRWFTAWLRSYNQLFVYPCKQCGLLLNHDGMFPTWRDMRVFDAYHETCRY